MLCEGVEKIAKAAGVGGRASSRADCQKNPHMDRLAMTLALPVFSQLQEEPIKATSAPGRIRSLLIIGTCQ